MEDFFHTGPADMPHGLVGVELYSEDALLRSLVVSPTLRRHGWPSMA